MCAMARALMARPELLMIDEMSLGLAPVVVEKLMDVLEAIRKEDVTVLLVDDSAFFRNMLAPVLKAAGYRVTVAQSGHEGLSVLRSGNQFDVVLTDIEMPDMNGFEFAEAIRSDRRMEALPIIALSSLVSPAAIERGRQRSMRLLAHNT